MSESANKKRQKMNAAIAEYFGFQNYGGVPGYDSERDQWSYPRDWYLAQGGSPNYDIPDFLTILEDSLKLMKKYEMGGPREYFGRQ